MVQRHDWDQFIRVCVVSRVWRTKSKKQKFCFDMIYAEQMKRVMAP
jgi:hypothetical protein